MIALPSLYLTTGEHLNHDRWVSKTTSQLLNDCDVFACVWLSHLAVLSFSQLRGWVPLFLLFHPIMRAMSVPSSNDCLAFSLSHHWGTLKSWQEVSKTTSQFLEWLWCVCMCVVVTYYCNFFLPTQRVSPTVLSFHWIIRAISVLRSNDCLAFSRSHHWGTIGTWQEVSMTTSRLLEWL